MKKFRNISILTIIILLIDQVSKIIVSNFLELGTSLSIIPNIFSLTYTKNFGAAWSIMWDKTFILIIISILAFFVILYLVHLEKNMDKFRLTYYGFILGGLLGNLFDRIILGYVVDFIDVNVFGYNFPIFNFSDSFIVIGVIMVFIDTLFRGEKKNG